MKQITFFLSLFIHSLAYTQSLESITTYGNSGQESPFSIVVDEEGSIITTGQILDSCSLDPANPEQLYISNGDVDIFVSKINSNGVFQWGHTFGSVSGDQGNFVTIDPEGNICVFGIFRQTVDFDPGPGISELSTNSNEGFFLKLDSDGNFISVQKLSYQTPMHAVFDSNGNMYLTGTYYVPSFESGTDLDPGPTINLFTSQGDHDIYISKFDPSGIFLWAQVFGSCANDPGGKVRLSPDEEDVYIGGSFCNSAYPLGCSPLVDVNPGPGNQLVEFTTTHQYYLTKLTSDGDFVWCNTGLYYLRDFMCDQQGNVYTAGFIDGTADVDPSFEEHLAFSYYQGSYVNKFSEDGLFIWNKVFDGTEEFNGSALNVEIDAYGNVYMIGYSGGDIVAFPDASGFTMEENYPGLDNNIHLLKLNPQGNVVWGRLFEAIWGHLYPTDLLFVNDGSLYLTGYFTHADFDNMAPSGIVECHSGTVDAFLVKLNACPNYSIESYTVCDSLTWIDGITYYNSNNTATFNLLSVTGCDSTVQLNLTVLQIDTLVTNIITLPSGNDLPNGVVHADIYGGAPSYLVLSDISNPNFVDQHYVETNLTQGLYDLQIIDQCGNQMTSSFTIVVDSNYQYNNSFLDSLFSDSLGVLFENCVIDYSSIDSAYIDSVIVNGANVVVIWNIIDNNGIHIDSTEYLIQNPNGFGTYLFQLSLYCPTKTTEKFYTANDAYFVEGLPIDNSLFVPKIKDNYDIYLIPNPTKSDVAIHFEGEINHLKIIDAQGKVIHEMSNLILGQIISLESYSPGIYYFVFETELGALVKKLSKE